MHPGFDVTYIDVRELKYYRDRYTDPNSLGVAVSLAFGVAAHITLLEPVIVPHMCRIHQGSRPEFGHESKTRSRVNTLRAAAPVWSREPPTLIRPSPRV